MTGGYKDRNKLYIIYTQSKDILNPNHWYIEVLIPNFTAEITSCLPLGVSSLSEARKGTPVSQIPATVYERSPLDVFWGMYNV
jgi:hypothetical protein